MTSISGSTSTLSTLISLYENENKSSGGTDKLTKDQVSTLEGLFNGDASTTEASTGVSTTNSTDLGAILDEIAAKKASNSTSDTSSSSSSSSTTTTTQTPQQKAISLMQSVYQSQQSNLFSLIG